MTASLLRSMKFIHDFYKEYEDTQTFEKALISLMLETEGTHFFHIAEQPETGD